MRVLAFILVALTCSACVGISSSSAPIVEDRFAALHERNLSAFDHRLVMERFYGEADPWTIVGEGWLAFATCREVDASVLDDDLLVSNPIARLVYASIIVEDHRRMRRLRRHIEDARVPWKRATIFEPMSQEGFFNLEAAEIPDGYIRWLPEDESWGDEIPAPATIDSACKDLEKRANEEPTATWVEREFAALDRLLELGDQLSETERTGSIEALIWRARFHGASLAAVLAIGLQDESPDKAGLLKARTLEFLADSPDDAPEPVEAEEMARALLLKGWLYHEAGRSSLAIASLENAEKKGLSELHHWRARYLRLRLLMRAGLNDDALELARDLPPSDSRIYTAYLYYSATLHRLAGAEDRFLQLAMEAFRDRHYESDPFLRALYIDLLGTLTAYPFETRTVEILEDMGPRHQTFERVEQFAQVALDRGRPHNAAAGAQWLLARQPIAREHPRFFAMLTLAAFLEDDVETFRHYLAKITARPDHLLEVVPAHRRSAFFAHGDTELARVLRLMLPVMAEWGESAQAHQRRQKWLEIIVSSAQEFLRTTRESLARPSLVELYRLAGAMLADHPRGYAERIGKVEDIPLILGTVHLTGRDLAEYEPIIYPSLRPPFSLTLLPRTNAPEGQWPFGWAEGGAP